MSDHLAPFALQTAFPSSSVGRNSHDYYEASVAIGLAPRRRSHVRLCRTKQRDVGGSLISFNALAGHRPVSRRMPQLCFITGAEHGHRFQAPFRRMRSSITGD
jgi:hypothetical protein